MSLTTFESYLLFRKLSRWDFFQPRKQHYIMSHLLLSSRSCSFAWCILLFFLSTSNTTHLEDNRLFQDIGSITDCWHPIVQGKMDVIIILLKYFLLYWHSAVRQALQHLAHLLHLKEHRLDLLSIRIIWKTTTNRCTDVIINEVYFRTGRREAILEEYYNSIITEKGIYLKNLDNEHKNNV